MDGTGPPPYGPKGLALRVEEVNGHTRPIMGVKHYHDFYEIYLFKGRSVRYFIEDKSFHLRKNDIIVIDRYVLHKTYSVDKEYRRLLIHIPQDYIDAYPTAGFLMELFSRKSRENNLISPSPSELSDIDALFTRLMSNQGGKSPYRQVREAGLLIQLLTVLNDAWDRMSHESDSRTIQNRNSRVHDVLSYINLNFWEDLSLDQLADRFFINKYHLCHIFKKYTSFTLIEYINKKRIAEAEKLLVSSDLKIIDIAFKTGFHSLSHFLRVFKRITGVSPSRIRRPERIRSTA